MFYNGSKLLKMKDLSNQNPEIFMCTGNRTSGKTTFFNKKLVSDFLEKGTTFVLIYRYNYELSNVERSFFDDINGLFFPNHNMSAVSQARGMYKALILDGKICGYAVCLNSADMIKRVSHTFNSVGQILFDEFQSETNKYCDDEISKFISLHISIARGGGKHSRFVPVYMLSNCVSILNPYYQELGILNRLKSDTKYLRGNGWVLEQNINTDASNALKESQFMKAFSNNVQFGYATENIYLNDEKAFIGKMSGRGKYVCGLRADGHNLCIKQFKDQNLFYCDRGMDKSFPLILAVDIKNHTEKTIIDRNSLMIRCLRDAFHKGMFRFRDALCKHAIFALLKY